MQESNTYRFKKSKFSIGFFNLLPEDWQKRIVPIWGEYKNSAIIYTLQNNNRDIVAGGIVFTSKIPNASYLEQQYTYLFKAEYYYIGYLWVVESYRNKGLASLWLSLLKQKNPHQKYWLTIEEEELKYFYKKNSFTILAESNDIAEKEWLMVYH